MNDRTLQSGSSRFQGRRERLQELFADIGQGGRRLRREPLAALLGASTLALATAAIATVAALAYGLFLRPIAGVARAGDLVTVGATRAPGAELAPVSFPDYRALHAATRTLDGLEAHYSDAPLHVTGAGACGSAELGGALVSAGFFRLLGLTPASGRFFRADEDAVPDRDPVAVLSYDLWQRLYAGSPQALSSRLSVNGVIFTVVGVAPPGFQGLGVSPVDLYLPLAMLRTGYRWCKDPFAADCAVLRMVGRLPAGGGSAALAKARAEMAALVPATWRRSPDGNRGLAVAPARGVPQRPDDARLVLLLGAAGVALLVVAVINLAGLLAARARRLEPSLAVRLALGASAWQLRRQLLVEALWMALPGSLLGTALGRVLVAALARGFFASDAEGYVLRQDFTPVAGVEIAAAAVAIVAALVAAAVPAWRAARAGAAEVLPRSGARGATRRRRGRWLLSVQAAAALALLALALLLLQSAARIRAGFDHAPAAVAVLRVRPQLAGYPTSEAQRLLDAAEGTLQAQPGVESVSSVAGGVLRGWPAHVTARGSDWAASDLVARASAVGPGFLATLRVSLLEGRDFTSADRVGSRPVAMVSRTLADRLSPRGPVVGRTIVVEGVARDVIGVVADWLPRTPADGPSAELLLPLRQDAGRVEARFCVRVRGDAADALPRLRAALAGLDPNVPITETMVLSDQLAGRFRDTRLVAASVGFAAALAAVLALVGLYGALSLEVLDRRRDIGIRMAIGATAGGVRRALLADGGMVVLRGLVPGAVLAVALARFAEHLLFGGLALGWTIAGAALLLGLCGLAAAAVPAHRAAAVDPGSVLRME